MALSENLQHLARAQRPRRRWMVILALCLFGLLLVGIGLLVAANVWFGTEGYVDDVGGGALIAAGLGLTILFGVWLAYVL